MTSADAPVRPREAASVILLHDPDLVYMTARPDTLRVAPGFYVFPGGRVDEADRQLAEAQPRGLQAAGHGPGLGRFVAAAVREVFEEVGLLLARDAAGRDLWCGEGASIHGPALRQARADLNEGRADLAAVLRRYDWSVAADRLAYASRWVTPPAARRRFDTRFFVADVTNCVEPEPSPAEVSAAEWVSVADAVVRDEEGTLPLMRPTKALLHALSGLGIARTIVDYYGRPDSLRLEVVERNTPDVLRAVLASQGVQVVSVPSPTLLPATSTNVYLIVAGNEGLLVDAGNGGDEGVQLVVEAWRRAGRPRVRALLLTHDHPDHAGAAGALMEQIGCPLAAHKAAVPRLRARFGLVPDVVLRGGETFTVGRRKLRVIHSPGHAADHVVVHEAETGLLFSGDNVVGEGSTWVGPPDGDMTAYLQSLRKLASMRLHIIAPGHGPLLDAPGRIRAVIKRRLAREAEILALVKERPRTVDELYEMLYAEAVPPGVVEMARRTVVGHLEKLQRDGMVKAEEEGPGKWTYVPPARDVHP